MELMERFTEQRPGAGQISLTWLGQAGFLIQNSQGRILAVDIYLSNGVEKLDGNKRLSPILIEPEQLRADIVLASHHHADHLDMESIPAILANRARLYCDRKSYQICSQADLNIDQVTAMKTGDIISDSGYRIEAVFADHGDTAPKALGFLIETEGLRIYFTGDTSYQHERMRYVSDQHIDLMLVPINGEYGNMNERDAAMLAKQVNAHLTIPCHFWTFARHQGSPYDFAQEMRGLAPENEIYLMAQGEIRHLP